MAAPRDLVDVVDDHLPAWRQRRPHRTLAAAWSTRTVSIGGRNVEVFSLPGVGTTWFDRRGGYWRRRVVFAVLMAVAVVVLVLLDVGLVVAAGSSGPGRAVLLVVLVVLFLATSMLYWRADLFVRRGLVGTRPWPGPAKAVGVVLGGLGMVLTPGYVLGGLLADARHRAPPPPRPPPALAAIGTNPGADMHGDAEYRRHLACLLTRRVLTAAAA